MQADGTVVEHRSRRYDPVGTHDHFLHHTLTIPPGTAGVVYMGLQTPRFRILPMRLTTQSTYTNRVRNLTGFWALFFGSHRRGDHLQPVVLLLVPRPGVLGLHRLCGDRLFGPGHHRWGHRRLLLWGISVVVQPRRRASPCALERIRLRVVDRRGLSALERNLALDVSGIAGAVRECCGKFSGRDRGAQPCGVPMDRPEQFAMGVLMAFGWCVVLVRRGMTRARWFFTVAWTIFLVGMIIYILKDFGVLPYTPFSVYAMPVGALVEMGLITAILASQIRDLRVSKDQISLKLSRLEDQRRKENFNIQMAKLRSEMLSNQMSPHFIFNVMSSIQVYIAKNDIEASVRYLGKFAKLMRRVLEGAREERPPSKTNSNSSPNMWSWKASVATRPSTLMCSWTPSWSSNCCVPTMVLQPVVENAIRHGFRGMIERAELVLAARQVEGGLEITVRDNGLGFSPRRGQGKKSHALNILHERSEALREQGRFDVSLDVHHLRDQASMVLKWSSVLLNSKPSTCHEGVHGGGQRQRSRLPPRPVGQMCSAHHLAGPRQLHR